MTSPCGCGHWPLCADDCEPLGCRPRRRRRRHTGQRPSPPPPPPPKAGQTPGVPSAQTQAPVAQRVGPQVRPAQPVGNENLGTWRGGAGATRTCSPWRPLPHPPRPEGFPGDSQALAAPWGRGSPDGQSRVQAGREAGTVIAAVCVRVRGGRAGSGCACGGDDRVPEPSGRHARLCGAARGPRSGWGRAARARARRWARGALPAGMSSPQSRRG